MQLEDNDFSRPDFSGSLAKVHTPRSLDDILREGSKSFAAAAGLLPKRIRSAVTAMYAFCRISDDMIDEGDDVNGALDHLHVRLDLIYQNRPIDHPMDRAFADVVRTFQIPKTLPLALLDGYRMDAMGVRYETLEDLAAYCARVAATVGVMMTLLAGPRDKTTLARACDLGLAMQLTNIARDVGEDARNGRIYLPLSWLREMHIDPDAFLAAPKFTPAIGALIARLLTAADAHYRLADVGVAMLPKDSRRAVYGARLIYADIGRVIRKQGYDSISRRAYTTKTRKLWLLMRAYMSRKKLPDKLGGPPHPAAAFLIDAVVSGDAASPRTSTLQNEVYT
jgi:15-cis-phytoene synthase